VQGKATAREAHHGPDIRDPTQIPLRSTIYETPRRLTEVDAWHEHIPFAFLTVELLKPRVLVELGVHRGDSYCAFCQAVETLGLETRCYGVDTWRGDPHSGLYDHEVLQELREHHDPIYGRFSRLLESTFDEAVAYFPDGAIDLLHIDGLHTYDSVRHDFETWTPKLSDRAVVILHDINVRERGFGVWRFWTEIREHRPHLDLPHGNGLGVVALGTEVPRRFLDLLAATSHPGKPAARLLHALGNRIALMGRVRRLQAQLVDTRSGVNGTEEEGEALKTRLAQLDAELGVLRPELERLTSNEAQLRAEHARGREELERTTLQLATALRDLESATTEAIRREDENRHLRVELSRWQAEASELQLSLANRIREIGELRLTSEACLASLSGRTRHSMALEGEPDVVWQDKHDKSSGSPMRFRLVSSTGRHPRGWGIITYKAWSNHGRLALQLTAKPRTGPPLQLRLPAAEGSVSALVRFPEELLWLGLEVLNAPEQCTITDCTVREIGRPEAFARSLAQRLGAERERRSLPGLVGSALSVLKREGPRGIKSRLSLPFWPLPAASEPPDQGAEVGTPLAPSTGNAAWRAKHATSLEGRGRR
jgi:hypothetical protein